MDTDELSQTVKEEGLEANLRIYKAESVQLKGQIGSGGCAIVYKGLLKMSSDVGERWVPASKRGSWPRSFKRRA